MAGYTRQSLAAIQDGEDIVAAPLNAEFDQLQDAFNAITGHTHDGTIGNGPKLALGGAVSGTLPTTNGGTGLNTIAIDQILYSSALNTLSPTSITAFGRSLIDDIDSLTARATLGVTIGTQVQAWDAGLQSISGLTTAADKMIYTTALDTYAVADLSPFARTILDDTTALAVRTTIDSINATNLTTGTVADARLPTSMAGKTFTSAVSITTGNLTITSAVGNIELGSLVSSGTPFIDFHSSGTGNDFDVRLIASGGSAGTGNGTLTIDAAALVVDGTGSFAGNVSMAALTATTGSFTGNLGTDADLFVNGSDIFIQGAGDRVIWFRSNVGVTRGVVYHDNAGSRLLGQVHNTAGTYIAGFHINEERSFAWDGYRFQAGNGADGNVWYEYRAGSSKFARTLLNSVGDVYIQSATDSSFVTAISLIIGRPSGQVEAPTEFFSPRFAIKGSAGVNNGLFVGTGDGATLATYNIGISSWFGVGFPSSTDGVNRITFDTRTGTSIWAGNMTIGSATYQTDGNILFAGGMLVYGANLNAALSAKANYSTSSNQDETNFPVGQLVGINSAALPRRTSVVPRLHTQNEFYIDSGAGAVLGGTWRACGRVDANGAMYLIQRTA